MFLKWYFKAFYIALSQDFEPLQHYVGDIYRHSSVAHCNFTVEVIHY